MEFFSTGMLSFTYADLKRGDRKAIAKMYGTGDQQLLSWLRAFTELRTRMRPLHSHVFLAFHHNSPA